MVIYSLMTTFKNLDIAPFLIYDTFWKVACENVNFHVTSIPLWSLWTQGALYDHSVKKSHSLLHINSDH